MRRIEFDVSDYHLKILRLFMSRQEIAAKMIPPVSHAAIQRWESHTSAMTEAQYTRLKDIMLNLAHEFKREEETFFIDLAEALAAAVHEGPKVIYRSTKKRTVAVESLKQRLIDILHGKTKRSKSVIAILTEEGYSGAMVQRVAAELGVKKSVTGFGRAQKSYWSLK